MKPRYIKRIIKEDFPADVQKWIDILLYPLNQNIEQTNQILTKNITLNDNIVAALKTLTVTGTSVLTADSAANGLELANPSCYRATIEGSLYGLQIGQKIEGVGILPGTTVANVSATVTLSQPAQFDQSRAEFIVGGNFPLAFSHGLSVRPSVVLVVRVDDMASIKAPLTNGFSCTWGLDGNNVTVSAITGLQAGRTYQVTFLII